MATQPVLAGSGSTTGPDAADWIDVAGLHKYYRPRKSEPTHALSDIDFQVRRGEFVSVVGPSGCGKTTLLKILAGLIPKSEGEVSIAGHAVTKPLPEVGMVFQAATLLPWRTILENVMVPVEIQKLDKGRHRDKAMELIEMVGLQGFEDKYPYELSGGMQQRAGICRALVHDPRNVILDEPTSALDVTTQDEILRLLGDLRSTTEVTFVLIAHDLAVVQAFADDVVVLDRGRVVDRFDARDFRAPEREPVTRRLVDAVLPPRPSSAQSATDEWKCRGSRY